MLTSEYANSSTFTDNAKSKFERQFNEVCTTKYSWIADYYSNRLKLHQHSVTDRYAIFVLHENSYLGGLGDRLGGLVSAVAFALRTNRTFLVQGDGAFLESFRPYHPHNTNLTWKDWSWSGFSQSFQSTHSHATLGCINPKPGMVHCALDNDVPQQIVRIRLNRAYLCRWVELTKTMANSEVRAMGITSTSDLFKVAGCMMRMAMWPTDKVPTRAITLLHLSAYIYSIITSSGPTWTKPFRQVQHTHQMESRTGKYFLFLNLVLAQTQH